MKTVSGKQFTKVLREKGWVLVRITKHHIYQSPGGNVTVSVPVHNNQDLKTGLLAALLKQTSLTETDL
jgi:predicted RNA binding protein YcfA (HicA-like mRNA interferase family)